MGTTFKSLVDWPLGQAALSAAIDADDTTITVKTGQGANLPSSNFYFILDFEQILISSRSSDTLTVSARGANGSSAAAHLADTVGYVSFVKKHLEDVQTAVNNIEDGVTALASLTVTGDLTVNGDDLIFSCGDTTPGHIRSASSPRFTIAMMHNSTTTYNQMDLGCSFMVTANAAAEPTYTCKGSQYLDHYILSIGERGWRFLFAENNTVDATFSPSVVAYVEKDGDIVTTGDITAGGGDGVFGSSGSVRGTLCLYHGSGGNAPGYVKVYSPNGTAWYLFVEDDGTVKVHNAVPTQNSDGSVVGSQT